MCWLLTTLGSVSQIDPIETSTLRRTPTSWQTCSLPPGWGHEANGPIDACGYHTGAFIATELALRHPDLVRRVVLIGIPFYEGSERSERYQNLGSVKPLPDSFAALGQDWIFAVDNRATGVALDQGILQFP